MQNLGPRTFASLRRHRNYRLYFSGQLVSQVGNWLQNAAQAWMVLDLTHSAQAVGILGFFLYGPYALLGLIGGALADRWDHRRTMIATQIAMALAAVALTAVAYAHVREVWYVYAVAAFRGTVLVLNNPSRQALMVQLVGRSELSNAIALNSSLNNATRVVGPAIAGVLIASVGLTICFGLNALSYFATVAALVAMRPEEFHVERQVRAGGSLWESIREGLLYARRRKTVAVVLTMFFIVSLMAINFNVLIPVLARQTMHGGPEIYGYISSVFGFGALMGALVAASRVRASPRLLIAAATGFGIANLALMPLHAFWAVALALFATGIFYTMYTASTNAIVQLATPAFMQGRVAGLYNYVFIAPGPIGSLVVGWLCERGGTGLALLIAGVSTIAMVAFGIANLPWPMPAGSVGSSSRNRLRRS